jgi:hypothetical protein
MEPVKCVWHATDGEGGFTNIETGKKLTRAELKPGAIWDASWFGDQYRVNGTGPVIVVLLPNGHEWMPGSRARNCGRKDEPYGEHDCWCVHGEPPILTVDKNPEPGRTTCTAGAGSIGSGEGTDNYWHGFLRDGYLVE